MNLSPVFKQRFFDANGLPLAGGQLFSYAAGTSTPLATYSNAGGTANTNPVVLDSSGYADVWLDPTLAYKLVLQDAGGVTLWTEDNVNFAVGISTWNANTVYGQGAVVQDSSGQGLLYVSLTSNNQNNALTNVAAWRVFAGNVRSLSTATTLAVTDDLVRSNSTSGNLTHTLPACATTPIGKRITVKDVGTGGNTTSVKGSGTDNVDGANTYSSTLAQYASVTVENNGTSWDVITLGDNSVTTPKIANGAVTQAKLAARATGTTVAAGGMAVSAGCGAFSSTSTTGANVTNLSVTIATTGRPVFVTMVPDGSVNACGLEGGTSMQVMYLRGGSAVGSFSMYGSIQTIPPGSFILVDAVAAGTYTYSVQIAVASGTGFVSYVKLVAFES